MGQSKSLSIKIVGMTCVMCLNTVQKTLQNLPGVLEINVNLSAEKAHIIYNENDFSIYDVKKAIEDAGYDYIGVEGEEKNGDKTPFIGGNHD